MSSVLGETPSDRDPPTHKQLVGAQVLSMIKQNKRHPDEGILPLPITGEPSESAFRQEAARHGKAKASPKPKSHWNSNLNQNHQF